jgi:hypothetical protein
VVGLVSRKQTDFTERDSTVLGLLHAHLRRSLKAARTVATSPGTLQPVSPTDKAGDLTNRERRVAFWLAHGIPTSKLR